jgi:hypothetical protein
MNPLPLSQPSVQISPKSLLNLPYSGSLASHTAFISPSALFIFSAAAELSFKNLKQILSFL